ncbi:PREDICTED: fatty acid-binding protein-like [Papilio polytes]|uniref:fatty acid-binding protein-like n=1 Tax=Papilio polytes TaxID=76194 RepID=UPI000675D938|nr:PREDICTED: fatty acid-binding protein-like [Papilio polytes]XP_013146168.1 PREDICTED: fatty acid-binding protein-like [Papilio polytes]XP_013146169.1 PREDICTED: fatty acid-binding protein-like [Papilio polytes]XP_013146170.1 PREDICTED: fatty acid-binding protein-like [Papilio polytes]
MAPIQGKYQHYKNENIDDYFIAVGVPYIGRKMMAMSSPLMEITFDGENMSIKNSSLIRTVEHKFKIGEEYEEHMPNTTIKSVTTIVNDNEIMTNSVIPENQAKCGRHYLFSDEECIVTLTHEKASTPGKRYFRRVKE